MDNTNKLAAELVACPSVWTAFGLKDGREQEYTIPESLRDRILSRLTTPSGVAEQVREPAPERYSEVSHLHELGAPASHVLKTWPPFFQQILDGEKTFEVRKDDRGFAVGDILDLVEYDPNDGAEYGLHHTGRNAFRRVSYVLKGGQFGIEPGYAVLGLSRLTTPSGVAEQVKSALRGDYTDAGLEHTFFRWPEIERAIVKALSSDLGVV